MPLAGKRAAPKPTRERLAGAALHLPEEDDDQADAASMPIDSIVVMVENRKLEVGAACLSTSDYMLQVGQFCDDQAYSKTLSMLARHEPRIIIFPEQGGGVLERVCKSEFPLARIEHLPRKYYNDVRGLQHVRHYSPRAELPALETDVSSKYLCLSSISALIDYASAKGGMSFVKGTLRIRYSSVKGVMLLDPATIANLELLRNLRTGDQRTSLFGVLNHCRTAAGARMLRAALVQPSTDLDTITTRLDCVVELVDRGETLGADLQKILPQLADCDRMLKLFIEKRNDQAADSAQRSEACIAAVLQLKQVLQTAPSLAAAIDEHGATEPKNELLRKVLANLRAPELDGLLRTIDEVVEPDAIYAKAASQRLLQCLFSVRPGVKNTLDVCRQTLGESTQEMEGLLATYQNELSMPDLKLAFNARRGYHFQLPAAQRELAEQNRFLQLQKASKRSLSCTSEALSQLNQRAREMIGQILLLTEQELAGLVETIQQHVHVLFQLSESVAFLDVMSSFATYVRLSGGTFARPVVSDGANTALVFKQARHPILERFGEHSLIANDTCATSSANFLLVTGPNNAGKSTYLRQNALLCLMAHVGCLVPAAQAHVPLLRRVFTRIGSTDCLESCTSTFASEMRETTYVLRNLGPSALVLVDELGRGTSNRDGLALAWAVAEELLHAPRTFTLFATHYLALANLKNLYPQVRCQQLVVEPTAQRLRFVYRVTNGVSSRRLYCTDFLAELAGIPRAVTAAARQLSAEVNFEPVDAPAASTRRRAAYAETAARLVRLAPNGRGGRGGGGSSMDAETLRHFLIQQQRKLAPTLEREAGGADDDDDDDDDDDAREHGLDEQPADASASASAAPACGGPNGGVRGAPADKENTPQQQPQPPLSSTPPLPSRAQLGESPLPARRGAAAAAAAAAALDEGCEGDEDAPMPRWRRSPRTTPRVPSFAPSHETQQSTAAAGGGGGGGAEMWRFGGGTGAHAPASLAPASSRRSPRFSVPLADAAPRVRFLDARADPIASVAAPPPTDRSAAAPAAAAAIDEAGAYQHGEEEFTFETGHGTAAEMADAPEPEPEPADATAAAGLEPPALDAASKMMTDAAEALLVMMAP